MRTEETVHVFDRLIRKRSVLERPFCRACQRGELSRQQLATCSRACCTHAAAAPKCLENTIQLVVDTAKKSTLQNNFHDELTDLETSPDPWLAFALGTGQNRELVKTAPLPLKRSAVTGPYSTYFPTKQIFN